MRTELENGFVICSMNDKFREALPQFYVDAFTEIDGPADKMLGIWAGDLLSPHHPTVTDDDAWMVIDPAQDNHILSALLPFSGVKGNDQPTYTLRSAALADIPCLMQWYNTYAQQVLLSVERTEKQWAHEITTRPMGIPPSVHYFIIENRQAEGVGCCIRDFLDAADTAHLIQKIAPALERRLQGSGAHHYTGQVKFAFHDKTGLLMNFEGGKLIDASDIEQGFRGADGAFPWHSFLNLVMGHHTLDDLRAVFPNAYANKTAAVLLEILFPRKQTWVMGQL